jgi:hypothetical protein
MRAVRAKIKKLENMKRKTKERYSLSIAIYGREWLEAHIGLDDHNRMRVIEKDAIYDNAWLAAVAEDFAEEIAEYEETLTDIGLSAWRAIFEADYDAPLLKPFFNPNRVMGRLTDMQFDLLVEFMARHYYSLEYQDGDDDICAWWKNRECYHPEAFKDIPLCGVGNPNSRL